jgi:phosphatidylglycerophosphatase A
MAAGTTTSRAPDGRFLLSHPAHFVALGFGSGLAPRAPGTFGTLAALGLYWLLALALPPLAIAFVAIPLFFLGIWAAERTARDLGVQDHGAIVIDEIAAFLPLAALASVNWVPAAAGTTASFSDSLPELAVAFGLFRLFDIWKPPPIRLLEQRLKGGFGVMFDDLVAACYAYVVLIVVIVVQQKFFPGEL